ncbi:MAG: FxLYD domain-containing protein [Synergistaceae bacterium]|jgi:hypothetical protein|nr:FxLYD domain-containing protein [Synergistaceae bacterium]
MAGNKAGQFGGKIAALLGIFFGIGFMTGFFTGYGYRPAVMARSGTAVAESPSWLAPDGPASASPDISPWAPETPDSQEDRDGEGGESGENSLFDAGLTLEAHELGEDENGLFISGTILNSSNHGYDAVRVTFDLCDASGRAYSGITDVTYDSMAPGDSWGFAIYIPYAEIGLFSSYRLQSIIGASR